MKKLFLTILLVMGMFFPFIAISQVVKPLCKLDPFWRNHPVLDPFLQDGIWIDQVPDYFFDTDFPYKKRPYEKEGLLNPVLADRTEYICNLKGMSNNLGKAELLASQNWENYIKLWQNSLTLQDFNGTLSEDAGYYTISIEMAAPESTVLVLE